MPYAISRLAKPGYFFRPQQLWHRARIHGLTEPIVMLPWGSQLAVTASDQIGGGIARTGHYELAVTETMFRLLHRGNLAIDVGANIGYFTSLMAFCVGQTGQVFAFEPNPLLREAVTSNIARWDRGQVFFDPRALSNRTGTTVLSIPLEFAGNAGTASLEGSAGGPEVQTTRLDDVIGDRRVDVLKVDVEGHEMSVLEGAAAALATGRIKHIFFEEHDPLPTAVSRRLTAANFEVFGLRERFRGVELVAPSNARQLWTAPTYLATTAPAFARSVVGPDGWRSLRPRRDRATA